MDESLLKARPARIPEIGGRVTLGSWRGMPLEWQVVGRAGRRRLLLAEEAVAARSFNEDRDKGCVWDGSDLQSWLEGEFAQGAGLPGRWICYT